MTSSHSERPMVLTIAGFDPSGGAGLLADIKVFEYFRVYGQAVCTALTVQNESQFINPGWLPFEQIQAQIDVLAAKRSFSFIKIGLVQDASVLRQILQQVRHLWPNAFVLWDPIIKASAGFGFHHESDREALVALLRKVNMVTPNIPEAEFLTQAQGEDVFNILESATDVLLKGGHGSEAECCVDTLSLDGERYQLSSRRVPGVQRHGSGCVLSSAILANLALGKDPLSACEIAKQLMDLYFKNGSDFLGYLA